MSTRSVCRFMYLLCIVLSCSLSPCAADDGAQTLTPTNQSGTIHLPVATSRWVDQTHMGVAAVNATNQVSSKSDFISRIGPLLYTYLNLAPADRGAVLDQIQKLVKAAHDDAESRQRNKNFSYQDIYVGGEAISGAGKPVYALPSVTYSNARLGFDIGGDVLFQDGDAVSPYRRSVGVSVKYELTNQARSLVSLLDEINADLIRLDNNAIASDAGSDLDVLYRLFVSKEPQAMDDTTLPEIENAYLPLAASGPATPGESILMRPEPPSDPDPSTRRLREEADGVSSDLMQLIRDYIHKTESPAVSAVVDDRFVQHDGTLLDYGLSASTLVPFRQGGVPAGVTFLGAVQQFEDRLHEEPHRSATRTGIAAIWQDRTPSYVDAASTPAAPENVKLTAPWNVKAGVEYTSPLLGLHETYAGFVRYRDVHTYAEITLTVGKDGLREDYADVSVGKSFVF